MIKTQALEERRKDAQIILAGMKKLDKRLAHQIRRTLPLAFETMAELRDALEVAIDLTDGEQQRVFRAEQDRVIEAMQQLTGGVMVAIGPPNER